ncbi:MAG: ribulose-phosphate 3-epimerase [Halobacteriales archaeon]|nr:ribulose-phosphate 3-epimerase [Halobacteriales archaeon]
MALKVAPSMLASDLARLADEAQRMEQAGADWLHIDIMDGRFVPNITMGIPVVQSLRKHTRLPLDIHLMVQEPERYVERFAEAGGDYIVVHAEATTHLHRTLQQVRATGKKAGVALNPATPLSAIEHVLDELDLLTIMSVNPGFGGQKFIPGALPKVEHAAKLLGPRLGRVELEVDGGVTVQNAPACRSAGASVLVAGTSVFGAPDAREAIAHIRGRA